MDKTGREYVHQHMPIIGIGTYQIRSKTTIFNVIDTGFECGYRFIDTAQCYGNESYVGEALKTLIPKHGLKRKDVIVTTKISPANQGAKKAGLSIEKSMSNLQLDYIDIVIIHWPGASKFDGSSKENSILRRETWEVLEKYHKEGKIRAIGVSNYEIRHLEELLQHATVLPCLNQVEYHPYFHQMDLVDFCKEKGIHFQAYSSFGGPGMRDELFADPTIQQLAAKYKISVPVFLLAWAISQNISILPRTSDPSRTKENFQATTIALQQEDVLCLLNNGIHKKACWDPETIV